jgi:hypothetical protein
MTAFISLALLLFAMTGFTAAEDQFVIVDGQPVSVQGIDNACLLQGTVSVIQIAEKAAEAAETITTLLQKTNQCLIKLTNSRDPEKFAEVLARVGEVFDKHYARDNSASEAELDELLAKETKTITNEEDRAEFNKEMATQRLSHQQNLFLKLSTANGLEEGAASQLEKKDLMKPYSDFKVNVDKLKSLGVTIKNGVWEFNMNLNKLATAKDAHESFKWLFGATDKDLTQLSSPVRREAVVIGDHVFGPAMKQVIVTATNNQVEDGRIREWTKEAYRKEAQHLLSQFKKSVDNLLEIRQEKYKQLEPKATEQVIVKRMWLKAIGLPESIQQDVEDVGEKALQGKTCWGLCREFRDLDDFLNKKLFLYKPCDERLSTPETIK